MRLNALRYSFREIRGVWDLTVPEALFTCTVVAELDGDCSSFSRAAADTWCDEETLANAFRDYLSGKIDVVEERRNIFGRIADFVFGLAGAGHAARRADLLVRDAQDVQDVLFNQLLSGDFSAVPGLDAKADRERAREEAGEEARDRARAAASEENGAKARAAEVASETFGGPAADPGDELVDEDGNAVPPEKVGEVAASGKLILTRRKYDELKGDVKPGETEGRMRRRWHEENDNTQPATLSDGTFRAVTPDGEMVVNGKFGVRDLDDLVTSDREGYDPAFQPRDRSNASSRDQIEKIGRAPDFNRLAESPTTDTGAPIVSQDGQVISGNGRVLGLRAAEGYGALGTYEEAVREKAAQFGIEIPEGVRHPVLVRVADASASRDDLVRLGELSNRAQILARNAAETAEADGRAIRDEGLADLFVPDPSGNILAAANREFVKAFLQVADDASLVDSSGVPTAEAAGRIKRAMLAAVLGEHPGARDIIRAAVEQGDALGISNILNGVMNAAPALLKLAAAEGRGGYDISADVADALRDYVDFKRGGGTDIDAFLRQDDFFRDRPTLTASIMREFFARRNSAQRVADILGRYAGQAMLQDNAAPALFDMGVTPRETIWNQAVEHADAGTRYSVVAGTGVTVEEAEDDIRTDLGYAFEAASEEFGEEITFLGLRLHGSRVRGDARADSDLDAVVEYSGDVREDALFDFLNSEDNRISYRGIPVDVNPIRAEETGTLGEYMRRDAEYDAAKLAGRRFSVAADLAIAEATDGLDQGKVEAAVEKIISGGLVDIRGTDGEKIAMKTAAARFYEKYAKAKIPLSTGAVMYFAPDARTLARHNGDRALAWAEYAIHQVSNNKTDKDGKKYREYNREKVEIVDPNLEKIVADDKVQIVENGNVLFFSQLDDESYAKVIAKPAQNGNYRADLTDVSSVYQKGKIPDKLNPLARVAAGDGLGGVFTSEAANGNIVPQSGGDVKGRSSVVSDADIAEARRQYNEVVARYTNADGTKKPGWMKAPNGKPTNLAERQWVQVRTENFKRWFGDWEAAANAVLNNVVESYGAARKILDALVGVKMVSSDGIEATLSGNSVDKVFSGKAAHKSVSIAAHLAAAANIRQLFEHSVEVNVDHGNKAGVKAMHRLYAPFIFGGNVLLAKISVKEFADGTSNRLYTIEAIDVEEMSAGNLATKQSEENGKVNPNADIVDRLQQILDSVKPENVSKVVDENGEPIVVYHGSKSKHNVYDQVHTFHISNRNVASGYGDVVDGNFVNARNVLEIDADGGEWLSVNTPDALIGRFKDGEEIEDGRGFTATFDSYSMSVRDIATFAKKAGYDGVVIRNVEDTNESTGELGTDIVTFSPSQVKSATDNAGTFDGANPDIRYSIVSEKGAAALGIGRLDDAKVLERSGASREDIWRKTKWWRAKDGKWRVEIPAPYLASRAAMERLRNRDAATVGELFPGSDLAGAYPNIAGVKVVPDFDGILPKGVDAGVGHRRDTGEAAVVVRADMLPPPPPLFQAVFARGQDPAYREALGKHISELAALSGENDAEGMAAAKAAFAELPPVKFAKALEDGAGDYEVPAPRLLAALVHELQHLVQVDEGLALGGNPEAAAVSFFGGSPFEIYRRFAGEVEARNVEKRLRMSPEDRAATPPWETEDVAEDRQIVRYSAEADIAPSLDASLWGDMSRAANVAGDGAPPLKFEKGAKVKDVRKAVYDAAIANVRKQPNYVAVGPLHCLDIGGVRLVVSGRGIRHGLDRRYELNGYAAALIGDLLNNSVEVPGVTGERHYRLAAMDVGRPCHVLVTTTRHGDVASLQNVEVLYSVNAKTGNAAQDFTPTDTSGLASATSIADLYRTWKEVFYPGVIAHASGTRYSVEGLYTGSAADYEKPSLHYVGTGVGAQAYGWGLYAINGKEGAEEYGPNVYGQTFFTNRAPGDESHLLKWDEPIGSRNERRIVSAFRKAMLRNGVDDREVRGILGTSLENLFAGTTGADAYGNADVVCMNFDVCEHSGNHFRDTSLFLAAAGIDGIRYDDGDWRNYVSFRDDNIRVDHKWVDGVQRFSVEAAVEALGKIAGGAEYGVLSNAKYGEIRYPLGKSGKGGFGFLHIVEQRMAKDGATLDEAIDTAVRVGVSAQIGTETEQRHDTHHLDWRGTRAIIGEMPDKTIVITGYEIDTEESTVAKQRAAELSPRPHVRSEEVIRALKAKTALMKESMAQNGAAVKPLSVADVPGAADEAAEARRLSVEAQEPRPCSGGAYVVAAIVQDKIRGITRPPEKYQELCDVFHAQVDAAGAMKVADEYLAHQKRDFARRIPKDAGEAMRMTARDVERFQFPEVVTRLFSQAAGAGLDIGGRAAQGYAKAVKEMCAAAPGYDLSAMQSDTGADLLRTLMEILPEKFAEDEQEKGQGDGQGDGEGGARPGEFTGPPDPQTWEEWQRNAEERNRVYARVITVAKAWVAKRNAQIAARQDAAEKRKAEEAAKAAAEGRPDPADAEEEEEETPDPDEEPGFLAVPREILEAHGVDLSNADEFAAFLRAWVCDYLVRKNPGKTVENVLDDEVALSTFRKTVREQLRDIAQGLLDPTAGTAANRAERMISDISDYATAGEIERRASDVIAFIQRNAVRQKRKALVAGIVKMIDEQAVRGKRLDALERDMKRKVRGEHEAYCRYIRRIVQMSDGAIERETARLTQIIDGRKEEYGKAEAEYGVQISLESDVEVHRAYEQLAALQRWGGLKNKLPGRIAAEARALEQWLGRERAEHENRWGGFQSVCDEVPAAVEECVRKNQRAYTRDNPGFFGQVSEDLISSVRQRLERMMAGAGEERREAISRVMRILSEGSEKLAVTQAEYRRQFDAMLAWSVEGTGKSVRDLIRELDELIPDDLNRALISDAQKTRMTWGQAMQLYASLLQTATYGGNVALNGRDGQAEMIRNRAPAEMVRLVARMRQIYQDRRGALSEVVAEVTGLPIWNPDPMYMPVKMYTGVKEGLDSSARGWSPLAKFLTPRVKNNRDFDLTADLMRMFRERSDEAARSIAFGVRGIALRSMLARRSVLDAMAQTHGVARTRKLIEQVTDTLTGGYRGDVPKGGALNMLQGAGTFTTYAALSWNVVTALKQMTSVSAWAPLLEGGYMELGRHIMNFSLADARELVSAPGFVARYGSDSFAKMFTEALNDRQGNLVQRLMRAGMTAIQIGDFVPGVLVGTGVYKARFEALLRQNPDGDGEKLRQQALTETWALIEECQQTGRIEDTPHMLRRWGILGKQMTKFATSPLQQVAWEIHTFHMWREAAALGNAELAEESRRKFINTVISNHVIMPAAMFAVAQAFSMALGAPPPEDEELYGDLLLGMVVGSWGRVFFAGTLINRFVGKSLKAAGLKPNVYDESTFAATDTIEKLIDKGFVTAGDIAEADWESVRDDLLDEIGNLAAPLRYGIKAARNYAGYDKAKERAKRKREAAKR